MPFLKYYKSGSNYRRSAKSPEPEFLDLFVFISGNSYKCPISITEYNHTRCVVSLKLPNFIEQKKRQYFGWQLINNLKFFCGPNVRKFNENGSNLELQVGLSKAKFKDCIRKSAIFNFDSIHPFCPQSITPYQNNLNELLNWLNNMIEGVEYTFSLIESEENLEKKKAIQRVGVSILHCLSKCLNLCSKTSVYINASNIKDKIRKYYKDLKSVNKRHSHSISYAFDFINEDVIGINSVEILCTRF